MGKTNAIKEKQRNTAIHLLTQTSFFYFFFFNHSNTEYSNKSDFPTEFDESVWDGKQLIYFPGILFMFYLYNTTPINGFPTPIVTS